LSKKGGRLSGASRRSATRVTPSVRGDSAASRSPRPYRTPTPAAPGEGSTERECVGDTGEHWVHQLAEVVDDRWLGSRLAERAGEGGDRRQVTRSVVIVVAVRIRTLVIGAHRIAKDPPWGNRAARWPSRLSPRGRRQAATRKAPGPGPRRARAWCGAHVVAGARASAPSQPPGGGGPAADGSAP
jgi:hypothetical protein